MARQKRKPDGGKRKRRPQRPADLPDRRALEGAMRQFVAGQHGEADRDTPLDKAQALMYRAFEEPDEERRIQLANEALETCPEAVKPTSAPQTADERLREAADAFATLSEIPDKEARDRAVEAWCAKYTDVVEAYREKAGGLDNAPPPGNGKTEHVSGYRRADGTEVAPYNRRPK